MTTTLRKNNKGIFQSTGGVGEMGTWMDQQTGLGYSGPKKKPTDQPTSSQVGQQQDLNRDPTKPTPIPISPVRQGDIALNQQENQGVGQQMGQQDQQVEQSPIDKFNMAILDMLQKAQGGDFGENLYARQKELQRKQIGAGVNYSGTEGLSPGAQERISGARAGEYSTEIDSIGAKIKANDARLRNFESILGKMREIGQDVKIKPSEEILGKYVSMIESGGSLSSVPDEFQQDVIGAINPDTWRKQSQSITKQIQAQRAPDKGTSAMQEYDWAGGFEGTGMTPTEWLSQGTTQKPPTSAQFKSAGYAQRMAVSKDIIDDLEQMIADWNPAEFYAQGKYPNWAKSEDIQSLEQAQRDFVNAKLREESGAAIAPSEFENAIKQYFPSPGDTEKILAQKRANRDLSTQGMVNAAGRAYGQTGIGGSTDLRTQVIDMGYDYDEMRQQYSDEEIKNSLEL